MVPSSVTVGSLRDGDMDVDIYGMYYHHSQITQELKKMGRTIALIMLILDCNQNVKNCGLLLKLDMMMTT